MINSVPQILPEINITLGHDGQISTMELPDNFTLGPNVYALGFESNNDMSEIKAGDLIFIDPDQVPIKNDYVVIYAKGLPTPAVEQLAYAFMPGSIGEQPHPESNVIAVLSLKRPNGMVRSVDCHRLDKVYKIIARAHPNPS
ncbi:hypothetical protein IHQ56_07110 [Methylobacillus flagellatus]|uniref:hypothetical protein n=1 Tax=Methylobacillus flagellatus TaxID=405 RepID=UPI002853B162|nr:hypothetical protein [Methylobacillus flagellatus]MDR5171580.1 hypothetical protein [Methylobacillus flagellatus]